MHKQRHILEQIHVYISKAGGVQIRARAKWVEGGERNTNCFLSFENNRQTSNKNSNVKTKN
jgi:hypothetical protein